MNKDANLQMESTEEKGSDWLYLAILVAVATITSAILNWVLQGIPLELTIPLLNKPATVSLLLFYFVIFGGGSYVGYLGLKELIWEKRFSVEFLMAVAAIGAGLIKYLLEGATVLFFYSLAEYFEDHIQDRARMIIEELSSYIPDTKETWDNRRRSPHQRDPPRRYDPCQTWRKNTS